MEEVIIKSNADLLAQAIVGQAYKDYRDAAVAVNNDYRHHRTRGQKLEKHKNRLQTIQEDLMSEQMRVYVGLIDTGLTMQDLKDRFEAENNDIFYPLWKKNLLIGTKKLEKPKKKAIEKESHRIGLSSAYLRKEGN
jgi:hypothetical protein